MDIKILIKTIIESVIILNFGCIYHVIFNFVIEIFNYSCAIVSEPWKSSLIFLGFYRLLDLSYSYFTHDIYLKKFQIIAAIIIIILFNYNEFFDNCICLALGRI